ncbi:MAG: hypothetical protein KIS88_05900 [Anaerolineales bacterium]|nr:hypothetical protein [Anaerolineales bacterium]
MSTWIDSYLEHNADLVGRVAARSAYATHFELGAGVRRALITSAPQYFRSAQGWQAYDLSLRQDAAARWGAPGAPVRLAPDGTLSFSEGSAYQQRTRSVGVLVDGVYTPLAQLPAGRAVGSRLRRETGVFCHELVLTEHGAKEELRLSSFPEGLDTAEGYLVYETLRRGNDQGLLFSPGSAVDADGRVFPVQHFAFGEVLYTGLAVEDVARATFPLVIDPSVFFGSVGDAYISSFAGNYATSRATSTSFEFGTADMYVGQAYESAIPRYYTFRSVMKFSLASLNPLAVIFAAALHIACMVDASSVADFDVQILKQDWSAQDPLSNGNREAVYDACLAGSTDAVWRNTAGLATGSLLSSAPLDVSWLAPGGLAYYSLRSSRDAAGIPPASNGDEYVRLAAGAHSTPALRPVLMVDYFAVPSATGKLVQPSPRVRIQDTRIKLRARRRKTLLAAERATGGR